MRPRIKLRFSYMDATGRVFAVGVTGNNLTFYTMVGIEVRGSRAELWNKLYR
jgi:hypothetical protein